MQVAVDVLIETIERCRTSTSRANIREIQEELRAIGGFLSQIPGYFPQLCKPRIKMHFDRHIDSHIHSGLPVVPSTFCFLNFVLPRRRLANHITVALK